MAPHPKYGEIFIGGRRWRWTTVGHLQGSLMPGSARGDISWSVCFRGLDEPDRLVRCEIPPRGSEELTDGVLRRLFSSAGSGVPDCPETGHSVPLGSFGGASREPSG
jgi:hypothetical protein